jgi:hypothetical protein
MRSYPKRIKVDDSALVKRLVERIGAEQGRKIVGRQ